jgi:hypothetical protein
MNPRERRLDADRGGLRPTHCLATPRYRTAIQALCRRFVPSGGTLRADHRPHRLAHALAPSGRHPDSRQIPRLTSGLPGVTARIRSRASPPRTQRSHFGKTPMIAFSITARCNGRRSSGGPLPIGAPAAMHAAIKAFMSKSFATPKMDEANGCRPRRPLLPNDAAALVANERIVSVDLAGKSRPATREIFQSPGFSLTLR